jgi:hypothetical protein
VLDVTLPMTHLTAMATSLGERGSVVVLLRRPDRDAFVGVAPAAAGSSRQDEAPA